MSAAQQQSATPSLLTLAGSLIGGGRKKLEYDNLPDWQVAQRVLDPSRLTPTQVETLTKVLGAPAIANDYRNKKSYRYSQRFKNWLKNPEESWIGKTFDSPVTGALAGGAAGWGVGKLGELLEQQLSGRDEPSMPWSIIGMLLSAVGGGAFGQLRKGVKEYTKKQEEGMDKNSGVVVKSAMYTDPRNFILERLQGATDISPFEKAQLAARVRAMNTSGAEVLKSLVRSAMGFGVGAIIAKFFGFSLMGGGGVGALAGALFPSGNSRPMGIF